VSIDDAYSALTDLWKVSPPDVKARFKSFIDEENLSEAA
jgi:hypothetical protein